MALTRIIYLPEGSGLGDPAPVMATKTNAVMDQVDLNTAAITTAGANATAALANSTTANTNALAAQTTANGLSASVLTALANAATASSAASTANATATAAQTTANGLSTSVTNAVNTANTANTNVTAAQVTLATHTTQIAALKLAVGTNRVLLSAQTGIDTTATTDSYAAFQTVYAACIAGGFQLIIDCKVLIDNKADSTRCIFLLDGTYIYGEAAGMIFYTSVAIPLMACVQSRDVTLNNVRFRYIGTGIPLDQQTVTVPVGQQGAGNTYYAQTGAFNNTTLTNFISGSTNPNVKTTYYAGQTAYWGGDSPLYACIIVRGDCSGVRIFNCTWDVPQGANAWNYIPMVISFSRDYKPDATRPGGLLAGAPGTDQTATYMQISRDVQIFNCIIDGRVFGLLGDGAYRNDGMISKRYTDVQNTLGTQVGGPNLRFPPPHLHYTNDLDESYDTQGNPWTHVITSIVDYGPALFGSQWSALANYAIGTVVYLGTTCYTATAASGPATTVEQPPNASYWSVGAVRRPGSSGPIGSLKMALTCYSKVTDYTSLCDDGGGDWLSLNTGVSNGMASDIQIAFNSATQMSDGGNIFGFRHPANLGYTGFKAHGIKCRDRNPAPTYPVWAGMAQSSNFNCELLDLRLEQPDFWGNNYPGPTIAGTQMKIQGVIAFDQFSSTTQYFGIINQGSSYLCNSKVVWQLDGWRKIPITLTAVPSGTSATIASCGQNITTGWNFPTGIYELWFQPTAALGAPLRRWALLTNGSNAISWTTASSNDNRSVAAATYTTKCYVGGLFVVGGDASYATRMNPAGTSGGSGGNYIEVHDTWNRYKQVLNGYYLETTWELQANFTPPAQSAVGFSAIPGLVLPSGWNIIGASWQVQTALGTSQGLTGISGMGTIGNPTALTTAPSTGAILPSTLPITAPSTPTVAAYAPFATGVSGQLGITSVGGTGFDGTGSVNVSLILQKRGSMMN